MKQRIARGDFGADDFGVPYRSAQHAAYDRAQKTTEAWGEPKLTIEQRNRKARPIKGGAK